MWPFTKPIPSEDIIAAFDPWVLACAVGADNGSIGSRMGFAFWLRSSEKNWIGEVQNRVSAKRDAIVQALRDYVAQNAHRDYRSVLRDEEAKRGQAHATVLGLGELMIIEVEIQQDNGDHHGT